MRFRSSRMRRRPDASAVPPPQRAASAGVRTRLRLRLLTLAAVVGPGLLAGLSDDDPAGITTYSVLGARYGYQLIWVLVVATAALVLFHDLGARMGVVTGQGLVGLIRQRYGVRRAGLAIVALVLANLGTTCAEFAGIAAGLGIFGVPRIVSVPLAAGAISFLVLRGGFRRIERVLLALSAVFVLYVISGVLAGPDWGAAAAGAVVPTMPLTRDAFVLATATVGTTLAPWGLSFIQSYAVDKHLTPAQLRDVRVDVVTGAVLTGVIGFFVVVACAATLHVRGIGVVDAADAARALEPLAGRLASGLFAVGLIGAAVLAASILPLSTAYSVAEFLGAEAALDDPFTSARGFYLTFGIVTAVAAMVVIVPTLGLVTILVASQVLNAVLLLPLLAFGFGIARDRSVMGAYAAGRVAQVAYLAVIALIAVCVAAMIATGA